eukprot:g48484.t1
MHRAFTTPGRSSQNRAEFSLLRMPHSHSQAPPYMGSLTFASHMGSLSPQRSASPLPQTFGSGIPWQNYLSDTEEFGQLL